FHGATVHTVLGLNSVTYNYLSYSLTCLNEAIRLNPNMFHYYSLAGEVLLAQGDLLEAEAAFTLALQKNPVDARSNWMLSFIYSTKQQTLQANQYYINANQIYSNVPAVPITSSNPSSSNWLTVAVQVTTIARNLAPFAESLFQIWE
ncbi:MAG: hypothetical protein AAFO95_20300, partial [Cyanobacteria bacterium J06600_6]